MAALLHTNTPSINQELCRLNTMGLLLDLFFKYTWNNFLHLQVELCVAAILSHAPREDRAEASGPESGDSESPLPAASHPESTMVTHLFQKCCLVQRILEAWEANDHTQAAGGMRRGNMGHLTRIANAVVRNLERGAMQTPVSEVIQGLPADCRGRWESFVEETLTETNRRNAVDLVSTHLHPSSEDEDMEGVFPNELSLQQAFSEYQVQQMTATFVDQFGFNDEEFADQDDSVNAPFDRIAEINLHTGWGCPPRGSLHSSEQGQSCPSPHRGAGCGSAPRAHGGRHHHSHSQPSCLHSGRSGDRDKGQEDSCPASRSRLQWPRVMLPPSQGAPLIDTYLVMQFVFFNLI
uniref:Protein phosphatase 6 regulatory subunit 2 n=1 Tax=Myotis myotis TaxID=51298 RepID=A0A7J7QUM2_MYOMY|nr:protein phosphatase 6 regulatory subunit 2 [Myotis myotis]